MKIKKELTEQDFIEMEALEKRFYSEEYIADYQDALDWYREFPYTTIAVEDGGRIIGFLELFPVSENVFGQLLEGVFNDRYLEKSDIIDISKAKDRTPLNLFLSCVVIDEAYRKTDALKILLAAYVEFYSALQDNGFIFDKVITDNVTAAGEKFSRKLGFNKHLDSDHGTVVYIEDFEHFKEAILKL